MSPDDNDTQFVDAFLSDASRIIHLLDRDSIYAAARVITGVRAAGGRLFFAGSGGGAGHASHATCDFRKLALCESYCVTDNVSELTARVNDEGWDSSYAAWLKVSMISANDCLIIFSVGGGSLEPPISMNLIHAARTIKEVGGRVIGIVGRDGGEIGRIADTTILIPPVNPSSVTPQTEGFQALIWHLLVSIPSVCQTSAKWESLR